jgi:hypothetical protein
MTAGVQPPHDVRRELYGGSLATFVERRKELAGAARRGGNRDEAKLIGEMRKPTAAAHLVNQLALADDATLLELIELGAEIRRTMATGDAQEMRSLLKGRAAAIEKTLARARALAEANDESVSGAVGDQIVQTLRAAMASDEAAAAVRNGSLTEALDEPSFGGLGIDVATRTPSPERRRRARNQPKADVADDPAPDEDDASGAAESRRSAAAADVERTEAALATATKRRDKLRRDRDRAAVRLAQIEEELEPAQAAVDAADAQRRDAEAALRAAGTAAPTAR